MYFLTNTIYCVPAHATRQESEVSALKVFKVPILKPETPSPLRHSVKSYTFERRIFNVHKNGTQILVLGGNNSRTNISLVLIYLWTF
jgi:hypothetical protein